MMMKYQTLPKALYSYPEIEKLLYDNQSCILFKRLTSSLFSQEKIATSHCFMYVLGGKVEVKTNEGNLITTQAGEMLFMPRDTYLISDFVIDNDTAELFLIFIGHEIVDSFLSSKGEDNRPVISITPTICKLHASTSINYYFNAIKDVYTGIENNHEILNLKLLEFLHLINIDNRNDIIDTLYISEQCKKKRNITSLMIENYNKNLTIADFANLSGRSLSTFNRDFKRKYGKSPKQWLIAKKMSEANKLLANGLNVTNCALEVGYSNVSHFIKAYKAIYGKTPKEIKNYI
jgi:AraC-like DNA-binding protein